jgi:peptidoglycan/xylan/chitin deacetylase (PgdA/CDA1 family)
VKRAWHDALLAGHEIGNHTDTHLPGNGGLTYSVAQWQAEMDTCTSWLTKPFCPAESTGVPDAACGAGVQAAQIFGFRTPYLEYNDNLLAAVKSRGFWYDASIEEGYEPGQNGTNFYWPYTLDHGSPGHQVQVEWDGATKTPISAKPGLWELPVYTLFIPPDNQLAAYGIPAGFKQRLKTAAPWFDDDRVTGFDYNLWIQFQMTKAEVLGVLKYNLDQRLRGNRAPFLLGMHSTHYSSKDPAQPRATAAERREAIEAFIAYALSKPEVRVVSHKQLLDWMRTPVAL